MKLEYRMCNHINPKNLRCCHYQCDDLSVDKSTEKTYSATEDQSILGHPCYGYSQLYYHKDPFFYITTPPMKSLFGVQKGYGSTFTMNLQFTDLDTDPEMKQFYDYINDVESICRTFVGADSNHFLSQIKRDKNQKYDPYLVVKLPFRYNRFEVDIYSDTLPYVNLLSIPSFRMVQCDIYLDKIWPCDQKYCAKWKIKCIHLL